MKSPLLTLLIIFNLLAITMVSASNMFEEEMTESHFAQLQVDESLDDAILASCIDESSCDHFCHITAHMLGFINQTSVLATVNASMPFIVIHENFHSLTLDSPSEPPQSLI